MLLFFSDRPGGFGKLDMWMTTRPSKGSAWSSPRNLGPSINTIYADWVTAFSPDGRSCYISDHLGPRPGGLGGSDIWQAPIISIVDFNSDGKVDEVDMTLLVTHWGQNKPLCDIGPSPWGDGVVDEKDLKVFLLYAAEPIPEATDVPRNVILSWVSPWFSQTHDVYFGTSFEDVDRADRDHPLGLLVSEGQTATTCDPEGLLEFGRTYYWRVDEVNAPPDSTISKGDVRSFTVEPYGYRITTPIKATASSFSNVLSGPEKTIDGSGLDLLDQHSTSSSQMWLRKKSQTPVWIKYEFDRLYSLHQMWVWNANQPSELDVGLGAMTVTIEYSTDGTTWTAFDGVPQFAQAPGEPNYVHNTTVDFGGVQAKYVRLTITSNWGGKTVQYSLSEVRFFYIPERTY
jgi:hypothetical protein